MSSNVLYKVSSISKSFGKKNILCNLSYDFLDNQMYGIIGESGNGKTTLLNILGLIDSEFSGVLYLDGEKIVPNKDYAKTRAQKIGFIFQSYYLIDGLTVRENIILPLKYSKIKYDEEYFNLLINKLSISNIVNEKVNYLSGGEKQRVSIARALINKPKLIICDEPTGNLDEKNTNSVISMLMSFVEPCRTIILVTHSKEVASRCSCVLELNGGVLHE